jgi:hypothetical protein
MRTSAVLSAAMILSLSLPSPLVARKPKGEGEVEWARRVAEDFLALATDEKRNTQHLTSLIGLLYPGTGKEMLEETGNSPLWRLGRYRSARIRKVEAAPNGKEVIVSGELSRNVSTAGQTAQFKLRLVQERETKVWYVRCIQVTEREKPDM